MNKKLQRLLCMLLAAAIMAGMMPAQVFAVFSCGHDVRNCSWHPCKDREKHQYMCDKCGKIFKIEEHDPDGDRKNFDYPTIGVEGHEQRCTKCGYWWDMEPHAYGYKDMVVNGATHPNVPVCLYCGYSPATTVPEKFLHKYSWHTKGGGHVYACEYCGYGSDGKANPTVFEHHYVLTRDNHSHWEVCAICGDAKFKSAHNMKLTGEFDEPITPTTTKHHKVYSCTKEGCNFSYWDNPPKDEYCDHTHCHYESIGNQHQYVCDNCGEVLSTSNHSINTSKVWKAEEVEQYFAANDKTQNPHDHMMSFYSSGHMSRCYECTAGVWERHTWKGSDASDENICVVYCEKCGYNRTAAIKVTDDDPDPHTYFKFDPIFKSSDKNIAPIQDPSIECSYTTRGGGRHSMKCEVCGYEHKEKCDSDGWVESDTPGKHWSFCSKCGGNMHLTECTEGYRQTATLGTGRHEVYCKVCNEIVSPSRPCQYQVYDDGTENYTNGTQHTFRCTLCGNEWTGNHIRKTIKENYVASVPGRQGHYDEVTVCELCGMELTREVKNLAPVASGNDNFADVVVRQKSVIKDNSDMVDADTALATGAYSNNLSRYVAEHASDFLGSDFTMPTSFYDENNGLINSGIYVVIEPVINVTITDYTLDEDDDDGDDNTQEFRSMTADISLTYNAYAAAEVNGVERRDPTYIKSNVPFDPTEPINFCVPVLNIESSQTALVDHEHNGVINTYAGVYASDKGMATVDFTTENGCSTFTFKPSDYWLEYIPREEPTKTSQGRIECWYARNLNKFYTDIECTNEVSYDDTFIPVINDTSCTVTFESGVYEHNPNKAPNVTGSMGVVYVDKGTEITLPTTCGYKSAGAIKGTSNTGYYFENYYDDVFIGWKIGDTNYEPGDTCTITGDTVVKARWQNNWVKNLVTLVFDANGGEGTMENQLVLRDAPDTIKPNTYTRDGYFFAGWGKTSTAVGAVYDDNGTYTFANHATLYAIWKPIFTVTYHTNGGEGEMEPQLFSASLYPGQDYYYVIAKLNANTFTREGYIFKGWSKTPNAVYSSYNDINYYDAASPILKETDLGGRSLDLYALWAVDTAYKPDVSSLISMDNKTVAYNGQAQTIEPTIDFSGQDEYTQGSSPTWTYDYYSGYEVSEETKLDSAPVNVGTYTVVATYNDGKNTGKKDRYLWIKKAERTLEISNEQLDLYGTGATITLTVSDDADNSAKDALTLYNQINENVVTLGDITWNGNTATIPITYVGPGYTHQLFTLDTSDNYIGTNAGVVVSAYSGYRVNLDHNKGGYLSTDKTRAMPNTEVTLTTRPYTGYKLDNLTVTNKATGENIAVTNGKFTMPAADVEVNVEYTQEEYTVNYTDVDGVTYTTQPMAAHYGDNITVSASIDSTDKVIKGFEYTSGGSTLSSNIQLNAAEEYSFRMPAKNVTVKAVTDKPYDVYTDESITNGSVQATPAQAAQGMIVKIMPTANDGYTLSKISCVYTGGSTEVPVKVSVDALGEKTYTITMPNHDVTIGAEFVSSASMATDNVADEAAAEKGASTADIEVAADDDTLEMLTNAALSVDVDFVLSGSGIVITDEDKADALSALATAGLTDGSDDIRIVEKNFMNVAVTGYEKSGDNISMSMNITPMVQKVATAVDENTVLDDENSVALAAPEESKIEGATTLSFLIPREIAIEAGGSGNTVYIQHTHEGVDYEYPATVMYDPDSKEYYITFLNPNGYSEFTLSIQSNTVASYSKNDITYYYTSFSEAIAAALEDNATAITMYKMPSTDDKALVTKAVTLYFKAAEGSEDSIDFDALYETYIETADGVSRASTEENLTNHLFVYENFSNVDTAVTGVVLDKHIITLSSGGTETLTATVKPGNAANKNVIWASDNNDVATVSGGKVTAVGTGVAYISVTTEDGGRTDTCKVVVIGNGITANVTGYAGVADGEAHGINVNVISPANAVVKYGTASGTYDLDESPTFTAAGTYTVYYRITADGYDTKTGSAKIVISTNGDVDLNGKIEDADAALLLKYISGTADLNAKQRAAADMDNNNEYNMLDVIKILEIVEANAE